MWVGEVWPIQFFLGFLDILNLTRPLHSKQYVLYKEPFSTITMQPQESPCRVLLELHGNSTEGFFYEEPILFIV